jgi:hypothetical protein
MDKLKGSKSVERKDLMSETHWVNKLDYWTGYKRDLYSE